MTIADYDKAMEDLVLHGDLYRLNNPLQENLFAEMLVSKDKTRAILTVMRPLCKPNGERSKVYLKGLDENTVYNVAELDLTKTGATLMRVGLNIGFPMGDFQTKTFTIAKVS